MVDAVLAGHLVDALKRRQMPGPFTNEGDFERRFVEPVCVDVLKRIAPSLDVRVHPWRDKTKEHGWRESKTWAMFVGWGMEHSFDLVARDPASGRSLAVEVKLAKWTKPNNRPNAQFQTMVGQCLLARLRHDVVVGIFAYQGAPRNERLPTTDEAEKTLARCGIHLVVRNVA